MSTTTSARLRLESKDSWTPSRAAKSSSVQPRANARLTRIGRGTKDSLCVLIAGGAGSPGGGKAAERLAVMTQTTDGFEIAEADLRQRGPGELLGTRQHGLPELRFGDLVRDFATLEKARADAFDLIRRDPLLTQREHQALIPVLKRMFGDRLGLIDVA